MANPFLIKPADYTGAFGQLSQGMQSLQQQQQLKAQQAEEKAMQEKSDIMQAGLQEAVATGDLDKVSDFMMANPDMSNNVQRNIFGAMGIKDENQKEQLKSDTFKMLSNPENIEQVLGERIATVQARGGDPSHSVKELQAYKTNPKAFLQGLEGLASSSFSPEYKTWSAAMREGQPEPMTEYQTQNLQLQRDRLNQQNQGVKPTTAMQNFDQWQSLPEGKEKDAFAQQVGISPKASPKAEQQKAAQADLIATKVETAQDTIGTIDEILADNSLGEMVGLSSAFPTIPGGGVADLEAKVEQFRNQLTLENLDKMTGVLTDRDIQVLASAASGLETNMSEKAFKAQLNKIKTTLNRGINKNKSKLRTITPEADTKDFPGAPSVGTVESGYEYIGGDPALQASWRAK